MLYLQFVFLITFVCAVYLAWLMWQLNREHQLNGVVWWVIGCLAIGLTTLLAAVSMYVGEWARAFGAHVSLVGGFGALWVGTRQFLGERLDWRHFSVFIMAMSVSFGLFYWFWAIEPKYQVRLTLNCVLLLIFSLAISQSLFGARIGQKAVTAAGVFYSIFALLNGFRTINILLSPDMDSFFLSGLGANILTSMMIPVLFGAQVAQLYMIREEIHNNIEQNT